MKTFLTVLKNDYLRTRPRLALVVIMTLVTMASILLGVYMTGVQQVKAHVALVSQSAASTLPKSSKQLSITVMKHKPPRSALVEQKYDAAVTVGQNGKLHIETLRSNDFKKMVAYLLAVPGASIKANQDDRGVGVNILGFMMMFLLMIAFSNLFTFAEDREQGQLARIAVAPASFAGYLAGHCVYCLSLLAPDWLLLAVLRLCGWKIGFSLPQYAGLMAALALLGIAFALLLHTLILKADNADMLGNSVMVLTTVLAGSFYSFTKKNSIMDSIVRVLPQKQLLGFAQSLQNGQAASHWGGLVYLLLIAAVLFAVSIVLLRKKYIKSA